MAPYDVESEIQYLARESTYKTEKPYVVAFAVPDLGGDQSSNHVYDSHERLIRDMRTRGSFNIDECGFTVMQHKTKLHIEDLRSPRIVEKAYYDELTDFIRIQFPEYTEIVFLDAQHRKRDPKFPKALGEEVATAQPLTLAHVDFTPENARLRVAAVLGREHPELQNRKFEVLNFWRILRGPNNDWPLALCDYRTVTPEVDAIANDIVYQQGVGENTLLFFNNSHQWYYLSGQQTDEILVFRNAVSEDSKRPRAWHAAFDNPRSTEGAVETRESLEVRVVGFLPEARE